jgi:alginate O-acetyltransferase complex protein AlgI
MVFNSFHFLLFFTVVTLIYFKIPYRYRWLFLLISSCYFYMSFIPIYILILAFTITIDYFAGILIERNSGFKRRLFLCLSILSNIGVLAFFKYFNFLNDNLTFFFKCFGYPNPVPFIKFLLPIGLSFHTFQAISYTIEIFRGNWKAERNFGIFSLYVMFYPQLVAGPIERPQNLLPQFREEYFFDYRKVSDGLKLMAWGLFKKIVIADRLALIVDNVYNKPLEHHGISFIVATVFFPSRFFAIFPDTRILPSVRPRLWGFG